MKPKRYSSYIRTNKKHWDTMAKRNHPSKIKFLKKIRDGYPFLEKVEPKISSYLRDIKGKKIIVPQFGDGLVLLACAKKGAIVTGVDLSSEQVELAKEGAAYCGVNVTLIEADWQKLPKNILENHFDLVVAEDGIFIWIRNLDAWMENAYRVLKSGGRLVVSDHHPLTRITEEKDGKITFRKSYFDRGPEVYEPTPEENVPPAIEFPWKLSDVINAAIEAGFRVDHVEEFYNKQEKGKVPLIPTYFLIVATKK